MKKNLVLIGALIVLTSIIASCGSEQTPEPAATPLATETATPHASPTERQHWHRRYYPVRYPRWTMRYSNTTLRSAL